MPRNESRNKNAFVDCTGLAMLHTEQIGRGKQREREAREGSDANAMNEQEGGKTVVWGERDGSELFLSLEILLGGESSSLGCELVFRHFLFEEVCLALK